MSPEASTPVERLVFDNEHDFLEKLEELVKGGVDKSSIEILAPHPVHKAEEILSLKPSGVRTFALVGGLVGAAAGGSMGKELEQFVQGKDSPNLYAALADLPEPLIGVEKAIESERANLKDHNVLVRIQMEKILKPAHDRTRMIATRLDNHVNALQVVEAIRHYAATHDGQLPQTLSDIKDVKIPNDLMSSKAFKYSHTATGAMLQSTIPDGGNERDAVHYEIVIKK